MAKRSGYSSTYFANRRAALRNVRIGPQAERELSLRAVTPTTPGANMISVPGVSVPVPGNMRQSTIQKIAAAPAAQHAALVATAIAGQQRAAAFHAKQRAAAAGGGGGAGGPGGGTPVSPPNQPVTPAPAVPGPTSPGSGTLVSGNAPAYMFAAGQDPHAAYKAAVAAAQASGNPIPRPMSSSQLMQVDPNLSKAQADQFSGAGRALYRRIAGNAGAGAAAPAAAPRAAAPASTAPAPAAPPAAPPAQQPAQAVAATAPAPPAGPAATPPANAGPAQGPAAGPAPAAPAPAAPAAGGPAPAQPQNAQPAGPPPAPPAKTYPNTPQGWIDEAVDVEANKQQDQYRQQAAKRGATQAAGQAGADRASVLAAGLAEAQRFGRFRRTIATNAQTEADNQWGVISPTAGAVASQAALDAVNVNGANQRRAENAARTAAQAQARTDIDNFVNGMLTGSYFTAADRQAATDDLFNTLSQSSTNAGQNMANLSMQARFAAIGNHSGVAAQVLQNDYTALNSAGANPNLSGYNTPSLQALSDAGVLSPALNASIRTEVQNRVKAMGALPAAVAAAPTPKAASRAVDQHLGTKRTSYGMAPKTSQNISAANFPNLSQYTTARQNYRGYWDDDNYDTSMPFPGDGWQMAKALFNDQKYDAPMEVVDDNEYQKLKSSGDYHEVFRGCQDKNVSGPKGIAQAVQWQQQLQTGNYFVGTIGVYGHGTYSSPHMDTAREYAGAPYGPITRGAVMSLLIPKSAKLGKYSRIKSDMNSFDSTEKSRLQTEYNKALTTATPAQRTQLKKDFDHATQMVDYLTNDVGVFAAYRGYDAYQADGTADHWVVLNRGMVISNKNMITK
jgi:hypothetical protein